MTEAEFQTVRGVGFVLAAALAIGLQRFRPGEAETVARPLNLALWLLNGVTISAMCGACACAVATWAERNHFGLLSRSSMPPLASVPVVVLGLDLVSYGWHRANHRLPVLWRFHQVHHSDTSLTVSTATRFHPGELLLSLPIRLAAVAVLGAPAVAVAIFEVVFAFANLFEHGNIRLPSASERRGARVVVTPSLHRRHHANREQLRDANFGTIFSVWDRFFGTYAEHPPGLRLDLGLPNGRQARTLGDALLLPLTLS